MFERDRLYSSLRKKYRSSLYSQFMKGINEYDMLSDGDRIAVCISGGKDSMVMALLFQELIRYGDKKIEVANLVMNPGYSNENLEKIKYNASLLELNLEIFDTDIFVHTKKYANESPCFLCAKERRWHLYSKAEEMGCNKIALGHHYDDVIETVLLGMLYGGQFQTMVPKVLGERLELIRPMYYVHEADIVRFSHYNELEFLDCACDFTREHSYIRADGSADSKRLEIKQLIKELKKINPQVEANIFRSAANVNLATILGYKDENGHHDFLEWYSRQKKS